MVYAIAFGLLKSSDQDELGYHDVKVFNSLALINVSIGAVFVGLFHWLVPEDKSQGKGFFSYFAQNSHENDLKILVYFSKKIL